MSTVLDDYEAAQRARLVERLEHLTTHCPKSIWSASINKTRDWKKDQQAAIKTLKGKNTTNAQLLTAVSRLEAYE